jgi:hypothetical protein
MAELKSKKNKHMNFDDRHEIQSCLDRGMTFKATARRIGKDQTTVSKEVKKHVSVMPGEAVKRTDSEGTPVAAPPCPQLLKAPFVCNGCKKRHSRCGFQKQFYLAKNAQIEYESLLSEAREGIPLNKEEFYEMDAVVTAGIKKGQRLYHIMQTNELGVSASHGLQAFEKRVLVRKQDGFPKGGQV